MPWPKHLTVDKRIITLLSASTYESFPRALRELVSNSYDADATTVQITIDRKAQSIIVIDNGRGMTPDEFDFFLRIAGRQRGRSRSTPMGRKRIGQFGIGFLAMFPFCKEVLVESTVSSSSVAFRARVPASRFLAESDHVEDVTAAEVFGEDYTDDAIRDQHYTRLTLLATSRLVDRYLDTKLDQRRFHNSIRSWPGIDRLKWELQDILPVGFPKASSVAPYVDSKPQEFSVSLNETQLLANDYAEEVLSHSEPQGESVGHVRFTYAVGTPWKTVSPDEARGLRVRLNGVGVGERQHFDLGIAGRTFSRLHWLTGEVNITGGLDEAITIDRDNFSATEDYDDFRDFFRTKLRDLAYFVEDVDEARRKIKAQLSDSPRAVTAPRQDVVDEQLHRLERRGFKIVVEPPKQPSQSKRQPEPPLQIDTRRRIVTVQSSHTQLRDYVTVAGQKIRITYTRWDPQAAKLKACRWAADGSIEMNQEYPLFNRPNKDIFRKLNIILSLADRETKSKAQFLDLLQDLLLKEFQ